MIAMCTVDLDYICDICGRPVEDDEGALSVRHDDLARAREEFAEQVGSHGAAVDIVALTMGGSAPWRIQHDACGARDADGYDIGVEKVRTWRELLSWTAQLMGKTWLPSTNWAVLIGDAAEGRSQRIAAHARNDAA